MTDHKTSARPRLLIEDWLPAQALGVECMRERGSASALAPHTFLHVWFARRPLTAARAAVLASLLPADFDRTQFERLIGFGRPSQEIVAIRERMDRGERVEGSFGCKRAFTNALRETDVADMQAVMSKLWGEVPTVIDPMAGGGSIPLEAARLGLTSLANEYNPVACTVLEATVDYPFRFGAPLAEKARKWGKVWEQRAAERLAPFYPKESMASVHAYIYARTVPCPDTGFPTPLCPDWTLLKQEGKHIVADPKANPTNGTWTITVREVGKGAGQVRAPPAATYSGGKGTSLFTGNTIPSDYIKVMAQHGKMGSALYAVATKATTKLVIRAAEKHDLDALRAAERELEDLRPAWEQDNIIPTEMYPKDNSDERPRLYGMPRWSDFHSTRQLLGLGILVEELRQLRQEIIYEEGNDVGWAVEHLLAFGLDKLVNRGSVSCTWIPQAGVLGQTFQRHDFSFKATFAEMAPCVAGTGLRWAIENVLDSFEKLGELPHADTRGVVTITQGNAANLIHLDDRSVTAVIVDPPYADNVQYSELADFFYVWLKRTQGHRRPEWFSTYLCDHTEEAVVNVARHKEAGQAVGFAKAEANVFYQDMMTQVFTEARRVLRDDGPLTVMFTHKKQEAWAALFESLIAAGFTITATWPVQTESQHSLHQAKKNAAQSTVILVARKREDGAGRGYYDDAMKAEITHVAQDAAARLKGEGLNAVDQLVGAFGPAMEVFTRYDEVKTDTGEKVSVALAIQAAADAVATWRVEQLARRGLAGVDADSRFVLLCWDVLGAAEFRFNEAMMLGRSVGMDVARLKETGLVSTSGDKVKLLPASERRRDKAIRSELDQTALFADLPKGRRTKPSRQVHPSDEVFVSAIDMCHALALRYAESGGGQAGIGAARGMALQQGWGPPSACANLMSALLNAAPPGVRFAGKGKLKTAADDFPEFRAWHALLKPLFGIEPPVWKEPTIAQTVMLAEDDVDELTEDEEDGED